MLIGIDGNEANVTNRVGIGEYAYELIMQFSQTSNKTQTPKFQIYLKDQPLPDMPKESENWKYIIVGPRKFWTQIGLPIYLYTHSPRPDVFFTPSHYAPRFAPMPTAIAIMDLSYIYFPGMFAKQDLYQLKNWTAYSAKNAQKIFTISNSSRDDIIDVYKKGAENVIVSYPGIKPLKSLKQVSMDTLQKKFDIPKKFILFVGTIQPRKNIGKLIEAYGKIALKNKDTDLVIVGKKGWLFEPIFKLPQKIQIEKRVHFLDFVNDEDLASLYKNAICFVLPSLYEGFGLPVLEAMQHGCPVVTSNISSLPEAGGDAALYVNPEDTEDIAKKITELIENEKLRKELIQKGFTHLKKFSWEKSAKETLSILESIVKKT